MSESSYRGPERRRNRIIEYEDVMDRLCAIDVKIGVVETKVDDLCDMNKTVKEDLKEHGRIDMWVQGMLLTLLVFILGVMLVH